MHYFKTQARTVYSYSMYGGPMKIISFLFKTRLRGIESVFHLKGKCNGC